MKKTTQTNKILVVNALTIRDYLGVEFTNHASF